MDVHAHRAILDNKYWRHRRLRLIDEYVNFLYECEKPSFWSGRDVRGQKSRTGEAPNNSKYSQFGN